MMSSFSFFINYNKDRFTIKLIGYHFTKFLDIEEKSNSVKNVLLFGSKFVPVIFGMGSSTMLGSRTHHQAVVS